MLYKDYKQKDFNDDKIVFENTSMLKQKLLTLAKKIFFM